MSSFYAFVRFIRGKFKLALYGGYTLMSLTIIVGEKGELLKDKRLLLISITRLKAKC